MDDCISHYDIMDCLLEKTRDGIRYTFKQLIRDNICFKQ